MVEKLVKPVEKVVRTAPKIDLNILRKRTSAKSPSGLCLGYMKKFKNDGNLEMAIVFQELYKQIRNIEESTRLKLEGWKGKSSFQVIKKPDRFLVITYSKYDQESLPHEITTEIMKEELNEVLYWINFVGSTEEKIKSRDIGEKVYKKRWKDIFSDRGVHIKFTQILRVLDYYEIILYRGGYIYFLNCNKKNQEKLK